MAALASDWLRHFRLLLWNCWTEFNETWQEARSQHPLPSLCFSGRLEKQDGRPGLWLAETFSTSPLKLLNGIQRNLTGSKISTSSTKFVFFRADWKNKMAALASDWLRHFRLLLWNRWTEFNETWQEARPQHPLPSLCFSGRSEKEDGRPGLWLAETFSTSPLKPLNGIQRNLTGSKISTSSTKFVFFWADRKKKDGRPGLWLAETFSTSPLKPLNGIQRNLTGSKISTSSTKFVFFGPIGKNKKAALASDWLRHFRLLLWNCWTEFNETWQEARSHRPLPSLCFSGLLEKQDGRPGPLIGWDIFDFSSETAERNSTKLDRKQDLNILYQVCVFPADQKKQDGRPGLWLAETFSTSPLKPLNGIQQNLTGSKISTSSTKFVFFWLIGKRRWPPWPLIGWDIFDFSSETAERNSTKLDRKQDLNVLYQVSVFRADRKNKMAALANPPKRWHIVLRCTICGPLGLLFINYFQTSPISCKWWEDITVNVLFTWSMVKVKFGTWYRNTCCGHDTDYKFSSITFKLHTIVVIDKF